MKKIVNKIAALEVDYPSEELRLEALECVSEMTARFEAAKEVEQVEPNVVAATIRKQREKYPTFANHHDMAWEKGVRDLALTLRVNVQAMLLGDIAHQDEKLLSWFRTIIRSFDITPDFIRDTYTWMAEEMQSALTAPAWSFMKPYMEGNITSLANFAEPATPRV